jgi:hypothetical protein
LTIYCERETNKMISWSTMHVEILIQIFDDGFEYISVVAADLPRWRLPVKIKTKHCFKFRGIRWWFRCSFG